MTTVGTGELDVTAGITRRSTSRNASNFSAVARSSRTLASPTTMKLGLSTRRQAADAGAATISAIATAASDFTSNFLVLTSKFEWDAFDDVGHERRERVVARCGFQHDLPDPRLIVVLQVAAELVHQQLLGDRAHELALLFQQNLLQPRRSVECRPVGKPAGGIDIAAVVVIAPPSDRVEVLHREADRIHPRVTAGAARVRTMRRHGLAHRQRL